jgi:hypothetical protein
MDFKTCVLGSVAPALAILAELRSPVSEGVVKAQSFNYADQFVPKTGTDDQRAGQKNAISNMVTAIAIGTAEFSGIVPTWISITTGLTAAFLEIVDPVWCLGIVAITTAIAAIIVLSFVGNLNFHDFGIKASNRAICGGRTGAK